MSHHDDAYSSESTSSGTEAPVIFSPEQQPSERPFPDEPPIEVPHEPKPQTAPPCKKCTCSAQ